jgi:oligoribonuclease
MTRPDPRLIRAPNAKNLAWIDLEMTGLDPQNDVVLQAALIITDADLTPLEEFVCDIWQPEVALSRMTPFVQHMHEKTGLLVRVQKSKIEIAMAERQLLERVAGWCVYPAVMCGNSIGQDKRFIERYMPGLAGFFSYRVLDVTSLKLVTRLWYGENAVYQKPEEGEHDALVDIKNSIAELAHYRRTVFAKPGT